MQITINLPSWWWLSNDKSVPRETLQPPIEKKVPLIEDELDRKEVIEKIKEPFIEDVNLTPPLYSPDHHDVCPFDYLLATRPLSSSPSPERKEDMVQITGSSREGSARGRRDTPKGHGKTVRFAETDRGAEIIGGGVDISRDYFDRPDDIEDENIRRGRFYRRSDGRFILKKERPLNTPGVYGPIPYTRSQPVSPQDIIRNIRYPNWSSHTENHENCPFREIMRIRPSKVPASQKEKSPKKSASFRSGIRKSSSAPSSSMRKPDNLVDMSVRGIGASENGGWNISNDNVCPINRPLSADRNQERFRPSSAVDMGMWRKWSPSKESPNRGRSRGRRRTVSFADVPSSALNGWPKQNYKYPEHGVGCRYRRIPNPLPWFIQCDVTNQGPIFFGVLPGLYIGNFRDSKDPEQLKAHNITHILSIHDNARKLPCNSDKEYMCIVASDSPGQNLTQYFPACNDFIHTARLKGGGVLIHCLAGMSRSVTVAVVYVMCVTSLSWRDSLKAVRGARNVANPNTGFLKQLAEFEAERLTEERRRLRAKFPNVTLEEEDEQMAKQLLASYYHSMSLGEMCEGNCPPGVACPRGLCHPPRR